MKTTPTLGLKLYDGTDAPDLVSGYNASMGTLDAKRLFRYLGTLQNSGIDLNNCHETGYWNNYEYDFTEANHGPVGSFNRGILVVYDKCNGESAQGKCLRQEYYPEPYGTGDAYRPMVRTLNSDDGTWTAWKPLVDVPDAPTWETLEGKPFSTVGKTLTTRGNVLDLSTAAQASLVPEGGAAGQVLVKNSDTDHDAGWVAPYSLTGNVCANADGTLLLQGKKMSSLLLSGGMDDAFTGILGNAFAIQCQTSRNVYSSLTPSGLTMSNDGGTTSYTVGANGKGILNNITMINGDLPLKVGEEFKLKSNVIGADYKAMSAAFGFDGFNPAIGMGVLRLGSQGVQATCAVRVEASLVGSNLFTIYAVVFEPFINKNVTGFYMGGSATTTSTVDSNIDWGDSIYLTPLTKLKA